MSIHDDIREKLKTLPLFYGGRSLNHKPARQADIDALEKAHEKLALKSYEELPDSVDLSPVILGQMPTTDQGTLGTCTAHALAYVEDKYGISNGHFPGAPGVSRSFNYRLVKNPASTAYDGEADQAGTDALHIFKSGEDYGFVSEALDPYPDLTADVNCSMPSEAALAAAGNKMTAPPISVFTLTDTDRSQNLLAAMNLLGNGQAFTISVSVFDNFFTPALQADGTYVVAVPDGSFDGGHEICIIGYRKTAAGVQLKFINSWGTNWPATGLNGLCYMAEEWPTAIDPVNQCFAIWDGTTADDTASSPKPTPPDPSKQMIFQVGNPVMMAFGNPITLDLAPMDIDIGTGGRTVLPARADAEARGDKVDWDEATKTVTITPAITPAELQALKEELAATQKERDAAKVELANVKATIKDYLADAAKLSVFTE
jgi:hypothetical protein